MAKMMEYTDELQALDQRIGNLKAQATSERTVLWDVADHADLCSDAVLQEPEAIAKQYLEAAYKSTVLGEQLVQLGNGSPLVRRYTEACEALSDDARWTFLQNTFDVIQHMGCRLYTKTL